MKTLQRFPDYEFNSNLLISILTRTTNSDGTSTFHFYAGTKIYIEKWHSKHSISIDMYVYAFSPFFRQSTTDCCLAGMCHTNTKTVTVRK